MTWVEGIAALFGLTSVWLTIKQKIWCWPVGLVQVFLYVFVFIDARLYADVVLHIVYIFLGIYGWVYWSERKKIVLPISSSPDLPRWVVALLVSTFVSGYALGTFTRADAPYTDSFVVVASLIAQWLMARKKFESWYFWITADVVAIFLYLYKGLWITSALYSVFLAMAISGLIAWRRDMKTEELLTETA